MNTSVTPHQIDIRVTEMTGGEESGTINTIINLLNLTDQAVLQGLYEVDANHLKMTLAPKFLGRPTDIPTSQDDADVELVLDLIRNTTTR